MPDWYCPTDTVVVRQGDILELVPILSALKPPARVIGNRQTRSGGQPFGEILGEIPAFPLRPRVTDGEIAAEFLVPGQLRWAILLTRGCDVDAGTNARQIAPILPLTLIQGERAQAAVIDGEHINLVYMPAVPAEHGSLFPDSFVDFRYITTLHKDRFDTWRRRLSVTRDALLSIYLAWIGHTLGRPLPDAIACQSCGDRVQILDPLEAAVEVPFDY